MKRNMIEALGLFVLLMGAGWLLIHYLNKISEEVELSPVCQYEKVVEGYDKVTGLKAIKKEFLLCEDFSTF